MPTNALEVNETILGTPGVHCVFMQWSDGFTNGTRTVTVSQATNFTATFEIRYA